jgi:hypothetical protein
MSDIKYQVKINSGQTSGNVTLVTVTVSLPEGKPERAKECIEFLNSMPFKEQLCSDLVSKHKLPRGGITPSGAASAIFDDPANRKGLNGYSRDFKWTASI